MFGPAEQTGSNWTHISLRGMKDTTRAPDCLAGGGG